MADKPSPVELAALAAQATISPMKISKSAGAAEPLAGIEVRRSKIHGLGVFAVRDYRLGDMIGPYTGRRYGPGEHHDGWDDRLTYLFALSDGSVIDGAQGGNVTRHINHACAPNVEAIERRAANGELELIVRATGRIRAGTELFLDYALIIDGADPAAYACACGTGACRGTMAAASA